MDKVQLQKIKKKILLKKLKQYGYLNNNSVDNNLHNKNTNLISKQQLQQLSLDYENMGKTSILTWKFTLNHNVNLDKLEKSFYLLIKRHPILSTIYKSENNKIYLIETKKLDWKIISDNHKINCLINPKIQVPMSIRIKKNNSSIDLIISLHHIASDELSWQILLSEISFYYSKLNPLDDQLVFSNVQPNSFKEYKIISSNKYWTKYLSKFNQNNIIDPFSIYRNNIKKNEYQSEIITKFLDNEFIENFKNVAKKLSISPISLLITSVAIILEKRVCQQKIIIGTAVDQREIDENFKTIGNFISIIPIIVDLSFNNLSEIVEKVHQDIILGFKNRFISLEDIISNFKINNYNSRHPLIDFVVLYRKTTRKLILDNQEYQGENIPSNSILFDLIISIDENDLSLNCEYKSNLINQKIASQILNDLFNFLKKPSEKLDMTFYEKLTSNNKLANNDIIDNFIKSVYENPDFIALEYIDKKLTRIQILQAVLKLASLIKNKKINPFDNVIIATSKSINTLICYLSALYYGIVFVPLDINQPRYKILDIISNVNPKLIITSIEDSLKLHNLVYDIKNILVFDTLDLLNCIEKNSIENIINTSKLEKFKIINYHQPAYIIFTSGTTGKPKGVLISRNSLNYLLQDMKDIFVDNKSYLSLSSLSFDISIFEILSPLYYSIKLIIGEYNWCKNPQQLANKIKKLKPNIVELTPSICNEVLYHDKSCINDIHVCCGGEKLSSQTLDLLLSNNAKVSNLYGPAEMTIISTKNYCNLNQNISIGKPLYNVKTIILDNKLRQVPDGFLGELYLFGSQIAQYYINNPYLTSVRFVANPFLQGQRMYRTGDLVYKDINTSNIYFCGRADEQLSIHGVRVEPQEIEFEILKIKQVEQCAIKVVQNGENSVIHAYFIGDIEPLELELELKKILPNYLRPVSLNKIDEIPKSSSGKIDRNSLPDPKYLINNNYTLPSNKLEILVANCFEQILDISNVRNQDNFFFLGGYSLKVTSLINLIERKTSIRLKARDVFDHPTVEEIALILGKKSNDDLSNDNNFIKYNEQNNLKFKLSDAQKRILTAHKLDEYKNLYNMPLVLKIDGNLNIRLFKDSLILLLKKHKILNTIYNDDFLEYGNILPWNDVLNKIDSIFYKHSQDNDILIEKKINDFIYSEFKLDIELPIKVVYFQGDNYLLFLLHHIVADEFSLRIIFNDIQNFYNSLKNNIICDFESNKQYFNIINQLEKYPQNSLQFWQENIKNIDPLLNPPFSDKKLDKNNTAYYQQIILNNKQKNFFKSSEFKVSPYHILISIVVTLLSRLSQKDVVVGIPVLARDNLDYEEIVGYFSNTLPIRVLSDYNMTCKDIIIETRNIVLDSLDNSQVPLEKICSNGVPFSVFIDYRSYKLPSFKTEDFTASAMTWDIRLPKFPVIILYDEINNQIDLLFSNQYYTENSSLLFKNSLCKTIDFFCNYLNMKISNINYYDIANNLYNFKYDQYFYKDSCKFNYVFQEIEKVAIENSNNYALSGTGYNLKYYQLLLVVSKISSIIRENNIFYDEIIVVYASKRIEQLILMLSVLHSGLAYVVLDANYPENRINALLKEINPKLILNSQAKKINLSIKEILIDISNLVKNLQCDLSSYIKCNIPINSNQLAYLCFTSGTTSKPKGVLISHKGLSDFVHQVNYLYKNSSKLVNNIRFISCAPMTFDVGIAESLFVFSNGGYLKVPDDYQRVGNGLLEQIREHNVTYLSVTPSVLETLGEPDNIPQEIVVSVGAEKVSAKLFSKWSKNHILINLYGPTEATINSLSFISNKDFQGKIVPVGSPDIGMSAVILDDSLNPVPIGVKGELYLGGTGLAHGYLNNFRETALRFIPSLFKEMGSRIYRTGDLASINENGHIILHSRVDEQFKIRGIRIEPSEIENAFLSLNDDIISVFVGLVYDNKKPVLIASLVKNSKSILEDISSEYRKKLKSLLPQYLIPQVIFSIDKLPLTVNGKIDKKEINNFYFLIKNKKTSLENKSSNERHSLKIILQEISNLLSMPIDKINIESNFLEIGGDSIVALQLIAKLKQNSYDLSVQDIFETNSIKELSILLDDKLIKNTSNKEFNNKIVKNNISKEGYFKPLPIVKDYLLNTSSSDLFAYSLLINSPSDIVYKINNILRKIISTHTSLRTRYINQDKLQTLDTDHPNLSTQIINFDKDNSNISFIKQTLGKLLNPYFAKNIAIGILDYNGRKLLLLMIHHLAVDIVSLKIILNDLKKYYYDIDLNIVVNNSLKECSTILNSRLKINNKLPLKNKASILSKVFNSNLDIVKIARKKTITLSDKISEKLFLYVEYLHKKINFQINLDIIFTFIISKIIGDIDRLGLKSTTIDLEKNGRDTIISDTVGWFTKIYKIYCSLEGSLEERLENILNQVVDSNLSINDNDKSEILINYIGLLDKKLDNTEGLFTINQEYDSLSMVYDDNLPLRNPILLTILEKENNNGKNIILDFIFSSRLISNKKINNFIDLIITEIDKIILFNKDLSNNYLPLTYTQEGLIQIENENIQGKKAYVINMKLWFKGYLDINKLYDSWIKILSRHIILNSSFHQDEKGFFAKANFNNPDWDCIQLSNTEEFNIKLKELESNIKQEFSLNKSPLYQIKILSKGLKEHVLIFCLHHILADGWSAPIIMKDLFSIYSDEKLEDIPDLASSIKMIKSNITEDTKIKYRRYLRAAKPTYISKDNSIDDGKRLNFCFSFNKKDSLFMKNFCKINKITLSSLVHALWAKTLMQITANDVVSFGSVVSGRPSFVEGIHKLVGLFSNSVPIIAKFKRLNIIDIARKISDILILASQEPLSFSEALQMTGYNDLFDTLLVFENYPFDSDKLFNPTDGLTLEKYEYEDGSHYPLTFIVNINSEIDFRLSYNSHAKFIISMENIKELFIENFNSLKNFEKTDINNLMQNDIFNQLNATSIYGVSINNKEYYLDINQCEYHLSNLTRRLISLGCHIQRNVVLSLPRSLESVLLIISILRTGSCFVPIDYEMEEHRYLNIINKVKPHLIINLESIYKLKLDIDFNVNVPSNFNKFSIDERLFELSNLNYAYIIHTSGTTGNPKGINMPWNTLNYLFRSHNNSLKFDRNLTIAHFAPNYFDVCIQELLTSFIFGHHLVIVPEYKRKNIDELALFFEHQQVDILFATNLVINELANVYVNKKIPNLSYLIQSGEKLEISEALYKWCGFAQGPKLCNECGPSETHVVCINHYNVDLNNKDNNAIGKVIEGTKCFVLDSNLNLLDTNKVGELYILGESLSYGYLDDFKQTSIRYVAVPDYLLDDKAIGQRMYRSGDLVYKDDEGQFYCVGRIDEQVKIKGVRIEIQEIIQALISIDGISKAFVIPNLIVNATSLLSAIILDQNSNTKLTISNIKERLKNLLPENFIPDIIKIVKYVPVNKNNKVDKKELRKILLSRSNDISIYRQISLKEHNLSVDIIKSIINVVLGTNINISDDDDFFALGGHSLLATKLANQINNAFNSNIQIKDIFKLRTPINIFKFIDNKIFTEDIFYEYKRPANILASSAQVRFWALSELGLSGKTYHIPLTLKLTPISDIWDMNKLFNLFKEVILNLILKHESLRTIINSDDKGIFQVVLEKNDVLQRLIMIKKTINKKDLILEVDNFHSNIFDLSKDLMIRFGLLKLKNTNQYIFLITLHHICCDAWSISIILNDIREIFEFLLKTPKSNYISKVSSYIDEIGLRDKKRQTNNIYDIDLNYWKKQLSNLPCPLNLPLDNKRTNNPKFKGDIIYFNFGDVIGRKLMNLSIQKSVTYFMVIQACIAILLNKMGCLDDIVIGVPDSGRQDIKDKEVVGCFINLLVLRFNLSGNPSFSEILNHVRQVCLDAYSHSSISFDILVRVLGFSNLKSHHPLFTVGVGLQDKMNYQFDLEDFNIDIVDYHPKVSRYDINFDVILDNTNLNLEFVVEYDTNLFKEKTIYSLMDRLEMIIESALLNSDQKLSDFPILLKDERLKFYNHNYNFNANFSSRVTDIVRGNISDNYNILIRDSKGIYNYKNLKDRSELLAKFLIESGVCLGDNICIICSRSFSFYVGVLSILRVGATYVPLLPDIASDRLINILYQTKAKILVTDQRGIFNNFGVKIIDINLDGSINYNLSSNNIKLPFLKSLSLKLGAYIIFTSGTTGEPKGILINRYSLACMLDYINLIISIDKKGVYLSLSPFCFDLGVYDVLGPLSFGIEVLIMDDFQRKDPIYIKGIINSSVNSLTLTTPSLLSTLLYSKDDLDGFKKFIVMSAGEALPQNLAQQMLELGCQVWPMYGPAETVIVSNGSKYKKGSPSLGDDFRSVKTYVLDEYLNPVPEGVIGQICIAGEQIADCYISNRSLTSTRFIANKFFKGRMYLSGDLGFIKNNNLYFVGRVDNQVSIRGHRVEIGEVIQTLNSIPYIESSAVKVIKKGISTIIIAYVIFNKKIEDINDIKKILSKKIPEYMIPAIIVPLDFFPLTVNGKIDLNMLPDPDIKLGQTAQTETQKLISNILRDLIEVENPNIDENFISLGMDSISVIILSNKLNKLGYKCEAKIIFDNQSIRSLASYLDNSKLFAKVNVKSNIKDDKNLLNIDKVKLDSVLANWTRERFSGEADE